MSRNTVNSESGAEHRNVIFHVRIGQGLACWIEGVRVDYIVDLYCDES